MEINPQKVQGMFKRHVDANVNTNQKENQDHQNNSNEVEDVMLKGHPMPQIS
jgi:hypothetical protein